MRYSLGLIVVCTSLVWSAEDPSAKLLDAVRAADSATVKKLLSSGASPRSIDETGSTALMYAGAFGSVETMRLLLDQGADVNAANRFGSTALIWSAGDLAKVQLLVEKGANVNARNDELQSALLVAARVPHNIETVKYLLAKGADVKATNKSGVGILAAAYSAPDPSLLAVIREAGLSLTRADQLGPFPLLTVLDSHDPARIGEVMKAGASPNEQFAQRTDKSPLVGVLANAGALPVVAMLLEMGADPNLRADRGFTPLMLAAGSDRPNPAVVRLLLARGARVNDQDNTGRTALDYATPQGDTEVVRILRDAGAKSMAKAPVVPSAVATPRTARAAVEAVIPRLQPISKKFFDNFGCISCHNQSLPSVAVTHARNHGIAVDAALASHPDKATMADWASFREPAMQGTCLDKGGFVAIVTYGLFALAEGNFPPNRTTDAVAMCLARTQNEDGSWLQKDARPPLSGNAILYTALVANYAGKYLPGGLQQEWKGRRARALEYLRKSEPADNQEAAFLLMGLSWLGAPKAEVQRAEEKLLALQRTDGGWGHKLSMPADAYATGQALHALFVAGVPATNSSYRKGVEYLTRTQREDGTWFMQARGFGFQPYADSGFPYGSDQFISAAASSWATLALDHALEIPTPGGTKGGLR